MNINQNAVYKQNTSTYSIHWTWSQRYGWAFQNTCQKDGAIHYYLLKQKRQTNRDYNL